MSQSRDPRRVLPSVNAMLEQNEIRALADAHPRDLVADAIRAVLERARRDPALAPRDGESWLPQVRAEVESRARPSLRPLLNASGVVLHTNLGRAPLAPAALDAIARVAAGYGNLEYDLAAGERGSRHVHSVQLLRELTGAEDALVVNNGAAALLLALSTLADGRDALVSRGELVEIGGSFRVPDIMARSGARLVEVGTTNRTHLADYQRALGAHAAAVVKVHRSNFAMEGFTAEVAVRELVPLAHARGAAVIHDLGSGLFMDLASWGLSGEPLARDAVRDGADVITMSGDKLLGGPQAGIILGRAASIARMRENPLTRALRVDKLTIAALEATLALYRDAERARREIPVLAMLTATAPDLEARARHLAHTLGGGARVVSSESSVGGGAFPAVTLPSAAVALEGKASTLEAKLRAGDPPVIGRIASDTLLLDLRSVPVRDDATLAAAVKAALV